MPPNPSPPAASAVETAEDFAARVLSGVDAFEQFADEDREYVAKRVRARDAAVRREALRTVADWCEAEAVRYDQTGPEAWSNALRLAAAYWLQRALDATDGGSE